MSDKLIKIRCRGSRMVDPRQLVPFQGELKTLSTENYEKLKTLITNHGFSFTPHVWEEDGKLYLIDGHQRTLTVLRMIDEEGYALEGGAVPISDVFAETFAEAKRKVLAATSQFGKMEGQGLYQFMSEAEIPLEELKESFVFSDIHMESFEKEFFEDNTVPGAGGGDSNPEPPAEPVSKRGDVWLLGDHRLMCGDSAMVDDVEKLMAGDRADMIFTDPPWNVNYGAMESGNPQGYKPRTILNDHMDDDAWKAFCHAICASLFLASKPGAGIYLVMSAQEWPVIDEALRTVGFHWSSTIIWAKDRLVLSRKDYHTQYEPIWYGWNAQAARLHPLEDRTQSDLWQVDRPHASELHPTTKPVELIQRALQNSSAKGEIVLDLFGGSGSTLVACEQDGRVCRSMELDPKYCDVIVKRWQQLTGQRARLETADGTTVFFPEGENPPPAP